MACSSKSTQEKVTKDTTSANVEKNESTSLPVAQKNDSLAVYNEDFESELVDEQADIKTIRESFELISQNTYLMFDPKHDTLSVYEKDGTQVTIYAGAHEPYIQEAKIKSNGWLHFKREIEVGSSAAGLLHSLGLENQTKSVIFIYQDVELQYLKILIHNDIITEIKYLYAAD